MHRPMSHVLFAATVLATLWAGTAIAAAQPAGTPDASPQAASGATPEASPVAGGIALLTLEQVPAGMEMTEDRERTLDEVTANFADPATARERFVPWGWERNAIRAFHTPAGAATDPAGIDGIYISIHQFGSSQAAAEALPYSFDVQRAATGLEPTSIPALGDASQALYGNVAYGNEVTIYVVADRQLVRLSASSPGGDPRPEATELMRTMLGGAGPA